MNRPTIIYFVKDNFFELYYVDYFVNKVSCNISLCF